MSDVINLTIDGHKLTGNKGDMLIEVADKNGFYIPRFCYHPKLSRPANCRMCLVEVEKAPKTLPACATPIYEGMVAYTQSKKTIESQKAVMEFLLVRHPLHCPVCDQGGECELQDTAMDFGHTRSLSNEVKKPMWTKIWGPW